MHCTETALIKSSEDNVAKSAHVLNIVTCVT